MEYENKPKIEINAVTKKVLLILGLAAVLLIPLSLVENQINSRREYETIAQKEVAKGWGGNISLGSPAILVAEQTHYPTSSETNIHVDSKEKKRGVFPVPVYVATLKTKVLFSAPAVTAKKTESPNIILSRVDHLFIPIHPIASVQSFKIKDLTSGKELKGTLMNDGIQLTINELPSKNFFSGQLEIELVARGTGTVSYESKSDQDKVSMTGNWPKPKFVDDVLPTETKLSPKGFEASWTLNTLQKNQDSSRSGKSIGLNHLWIGTDYTMIERAVKYGILFIALTFLLVFIVEFMSKAKIHPLQYGLIGLSISIFYLLLLAISESIGFDIAYLISSGAVTGLIVFYVRGFLNDTKFVKMILTEQLVLSGFFYVLLSLEESAFLIGSIGLFTALAIFMTITRKFDWYSGSFKTHDNKMA